MSRLHDSHAPTDVVRLVGCYDAPVVFVEVDVADDVQSAAIQVAPRHAASGLRLRIPPLLVAHPSVAARPKLNVRIRPDDKPLKNVLANTGMRQTGRVHEGELALDVWTGDTLTQPVERLRAVSRHLGYEIEMWHRAIALSDPHLLQSYIEGDYLRETVQNALVESFTVHTRALIDFLYAEPGREESRKHVNDVFAYHFFTTGEWAAMKRQTNGLKDPTAGSNDMKLRAARERVGGEIAHLSYGRLEPDNQGRLWETGAIVATLREDLCTFIDQMPEGRGDAKLRSARMAIMAATSPMPAHARSSPGGVQVKSDEPLPPMKLGAPPPASGPPGVATGMLRVESPRDPEA